MSTKSNYWWNRPDLTYQDGLLHLGKKDVLSLTKSTDTPFYVYHKQRIIDNIERIDKHLNRHVDNYKIYYAMKANRHKGILNAIANESTCGIDACSPSEVSLAINCGFQPSKISVTSTAVSDRDWEVYKDYPEIRFNCDSISSLKRVIKNGYRSEIGLRINPSIGVGYGDNKLLKYSGKIATKFGIYEDTIDDAIRIAKQGNIKIVGLHMHAGSGFLTNGFEDYRKALEHITELSKNFDDLEYINIGGGLGIPLTSDDQPFDIELWAQIIAKTVGQSGKQICVEPGDHITKDAGILVAQVIEVEQKSGTTFVFVDAGFNNHPEPAFYHLPLEPVTIVEDKSNSIQIVTIAGNINEALDIFNKNHNLKVDPGEYIAFLNAGAYGSSMSSNHCLRSTAQEILI